MKHTNHLWPIDLSKSFAIWGIDNVGILPRASEGLRFLFVAIDTFTKLMEAMPVVNITQKVVVVDVSYAIPQAHGIINVSLH
jgi:hypothetical protein